MKPKLLYQLTFEGSWPVAVTFLEHERRVAAGNQDGELFVWDLPETPPELPEPKEKNPERKREAPDVPPARKLVGHTNTITKLLYDAGRKLLLSSSYDRTIRGWNVGDATPETAEAILDRESREREFKRTKKEVERPGVTVGVQPSAFALEGHTDWIHTLAATRDGGKLISGDAAAQVIVWDTAEKKQLTKWRGHPWNWILAAAFSPDGKSAVVSEHRYKRDDFDIPAAALKTWNVEDGSEKLDLLKVQFPKLKPEGTSYGDGQLWRKFIQQGLVAVAYSPDGALIAAAQGGETDSGKIHVLEAETGKLLRTIGGHQYGATDVCFSSDGKLLFSAGRDTCVRVQQVEDGKEVAVLGTSRGGQFKDWIAAIALSPDERFLAAADIAGHVAIWRLDAS